MDGKVIRRYQINLYGDEEGFIVEYLGPFPIPDEGPKSKFFRVNSLTEIRPTPAEMRGE